MMRVFRELRAAQRRRLVSQSINGRKSLHALLSTQTVFIHIPKCGGKTIIKEIYGLGLHDYFGHANIEFYKSVLGPRRFNDYLKFSAVREPFERTYSAFTFGKKGGFGFKTDKEIARRLKGVGWSEFVNTNLLKEFSETYVTFRPQINFVIDKSGRVACDMLVRTCDLSKAITDFNGRKQPSEVPLINASKAWGKTPRRMGEEESIIRQVYPLDFDLYNGKFAPLKAHIAKRSS